MENIQVFQQENQIVFTMLNKEKKIMNNQLEQNKLNAIAFYKTMFDGNPEKAIELYVGDEYRQHNPMVADGKAGIIEYFTRMKKEYPIKEVRFVRAIAQGDLVALHTHQIWREPDNKEYITMDFFCFDENNKIVEHWDSIQKVIKDTKSGRTMY